MNIIDVVPVSRGISVDTLTYFTSSEIAVGSVVSVPLRKKNISAIVLACRNAIDSKSEIRSADFEIKKVSHLSSTPFFTREFMQACEETATYFACSTGSLLYSLIPQTILANLDKLSGAIAANTATHTVAPEGYEKIDEKYALQAADEERFSDYRAFIREQFARKSSVFFCMPTIHDIETAVPKLEKGIEEYTHVLHGSIRPKQLIEEYATLLSEPHPVLIIATVPFLSLPRRDIGAIVLEKENSKGYKIQGRPFADLRVFAEKLAKRIHARLIVGDLFLQTETMFRHKNGEYQDLYPLKFRSLSNAECHVVDLRRYKSAGHHFTVISDELAALIEKNRVQNENLFIYSARKGVSPTTICADCGTIVTCDACGNHAVLHLSPPGNFFLCHHCGERRKADELCKNCGGWRLTTLGIGIERVADEIRQRFPELRIFVFDKEKVTTYKRAVAMMADFYSSPGSVLIGTEMALLYLDKPVENSAVASIDSLFSIPDFRISERVLGILLKMRAVTSSTMLVQTRDPDQPVFTHALRGNIMDFYHDELLLRKKFSYPPYSTLIKISLEGKRDEIAEEMARTKALLEQYEVNVFPSFIKGYGGNSLLHALLLVPAGEWPDEKLLAKLRSLPPNHTIKVDPESLL